MLVDRQPFVATVNLTLAPGTAQEHGKKEVDHYTLLNNRQNSLLSAGNTSLSKAMTEFMLSKSMTEKTAI